MPNWFDEFRYTVAFKLVQTGERANPDERPDRDDLNMFWAHNRYTWRSINPGCGWKGEGAGSARLVAEFAHEREE